jgi:hydrogenase expression/formation protein HypD
VKHLVEYRDRALAQRVVRAIHAVTTRSWTIMEVCGGQTHTIVRHGIDALLADTVELIHGPGCPVCVTPIEDIDAAVSVAQRPGTIFVSFGDMLRVPGTSATLLEARAGGADVRTVYSPLDALEIAQRHPDCEVVFFAVGFETTAPTTATVVRRAREIGVQNFTLLVSHVTVLPAVTAILSSPENRVQAVLAPGHVCTVMGWREYEPLAAAYGVPIVVTGFEPVDILQGVLMAVRQLEHGRCCVENHYPRSVRREGNLRAQEVMNDVFARVDRSWRGLGIIPAGGLALRDAYADFDARRRFELSGGSAESPAACRAGEVLRGRCKPVECPAFGRECTPTRPLGAPMVSSEGACAAYYRHRSPAGKVDDP